MKSTYLLTPDIDIAETRLTEEMSSNRENFCESSLLHRPQSVEYPDLTGQLEEPGQRMWKPAQIVPSHQIPASPIKYSDIPTSDNHHYPTIPLSPPHQVPPTPYDYPLLYHLLMLQNYCYHNFQDLYNFGQRGSCPSTSPIKPPKKRKVSHHQTEPLDLSFKSESPDTTASGFLLNENNISYDESIKDNEEVEVVAKDNADDRQETPVYQKKGESVKEFVQRKISEYNKSDSEFKVFVTESNLKERDIKEKMSQIKEKYSHISSKIRRLEEKKEKLITEHHKEQNNNDLNIPEDENISKMAIAEEDDSRSKRKEDTRIYLDRDDLKDGIRVLVRLDNVMHPGRLTVIVPGEIYGVVVDKERGHKPHVFSREELLQRVVKDIKPGGVERHQKESDSNAADKGGLLRLGSRVCVYWSAMMNYLHPGIVTGLDDSQYVIVSTDDGDTRDVHINQVRLLPTDFSTLGNL